MLFRVMNPASLTLTVLDSKGRHKGYKTLHVNLKSIEEAKKEVRNKVVFGVVILTFLMMLLSFSKDFVFPLAQEIASQFLSESSTSGNESSDLLTNGGHAPASIPNRNGFERVIDSKEESTILNPKWSQSIQKNAESGKGEFLSPPPHNTTACGSPPGGQAHRAFHKAYRAVSG